jgi:hypothetical protein
VAAAGRGLVESRYSWRRIGEDFADRLEALAAH